MLITLEPAKNRELIDHEKPRHKRELSHNNPVHNISEDRPHDAVCQNKSFLTREKPNQSKTCPRSSIEAPSTITTLHELIQNHLTSSYWCDISFDSSCTSHCSQKRNKTKNQLHMSFPAATTPKKTKRHYTI